MSAWKLVEAVAEEEPALEKKNEEQRNNNSGRGSYQNRGRGRGRNSNGKGNRGHGRSNQYNDGSNYLTESDINYYSHMAVQQIEFIFDLNNLCMDTFVRSYMDEDGYVPLALLCNYQNVACYCTSYYDVLKKISELNDRVDSKLEVDAINEKVRLKAGWDMWLMPNASGGKGLPRYLKQAEESEPTNITSSEQNDNINKNMVENNQII